MYNFAKRLLFLLEPESAHNLIENTLHVSGKYLPFLIDLVDKNFRFEHKELEQDIFGVKFKNPIGLGAGFDKNASMLRGLEALGFGFIEYGTLTPKPQKGNNKPRLFRYPEHNSIQNAMGFNNHGLERVLQNLAKDKLTQTPLGASIGKNKTTLNEKALDDYKILISSLSQYCDYFAINISSPNTKGLRDLQNEEFLSEILKESKSLTNKPIFVKLSPDMQIENALKLCQIVHENSAQGIIATNTTIDYSLLDGAKDFGGISGEVLKNKSREFFEQIAKDFHDKLTLISVGGISTGEEAYNRIKLGASLIQIYSGLIFKGPSLVKKMSEDLLFLLKRDGYLHVNEAIGSKWR